MWFFNIIGLGCFLYGLFYLIALGFVDCDLGLAFYKKFGKSPRKLKGQVVFITGASSGIGEHTAYALAKYGVKLVLTARRRDQLDRVKRNCLELSKGKLQDNDILVISMDMTDFLSHEKYFNEAIRHFGRVDIVFNNAGRSQRANWENIEITVDKQLFDLNVFGVINLTRIAVNYFNKKGIYGHVAVVSSLAGLFGVPYSGSYTASKHAIHGYYNSLRTEKIDNKLSVTIICPGPTFTNFLSESFTEKNGFKYGISAQKTDKRMTGEMCGELCAISLANKLNETWLGLPPMILFVYCAVYFPQIYYFIVKIIGPKRLFKMRDGKDLTLEETNIMTKNQQTDKDSFINLITLPSEKEI